MRCDAMRYDENYRDLMRPVARQRQDRARHGRLGQARPGQGKDSPSPPLHILIYGPSSHQPRLGNPNEMYSIRSYPAEPAHSCLFYPYTLPTYLPTYPLPNYPPTRLRLRKLSFQTGGCDCCVSCSRRKQATEKTRRRDKKGEGEGEGGESHSLRFVVPLGPGSQ